MDEIKQIVNFVLSSCNSLFFTLTQFSIFSALIGVLIISVAVGLVVFAVRNSGFGINFKSSKVSSFNVPKTVKFNVPHVRSFISPKQIKFNIPRISSFRNFRSYIKYRYKNDYKNNELQAERLKDNIIYSNNKIADLKRRIAIESSKIKNWSNDYDFLSAAANYYEIKGGIINNNRAHSIRLRMSHLITNMQNSTANISSYDDQIKLHESRLIGFKNRLSKLRLKKSGSLGDDEAYFSASDSDDS